MAKHATAITTRDENLPSENVNFLDQYANEDAGKGISTSAADKQVPILRVLQSMSPQVKPSNPAHIQGATDGTIWMRGAPKQLVSGQEGFIFQPCYFTKHVVEWIPREQGGGFVTRHQFLPEDNEDIARIGHRLAARADGKNKFKWILRDGHELIETRYHIGNVIFGPNQISQFVIPFTGSGHSVSRQWMQQLDQHRKYAASFGTLWRMKTRAARNALGEWYILDPQFLGYIDRAELPSELNGLDRLALYQAGKTLYESMASGEREIGEEAENGLGESDDGSGATRAGI